MGTHDNPTGWRLSDSPNTVTAAAFSENVPDESGGANDPVTFMNGGESGEKRYFSVKNTDEAKLVLENHDNLKSAHFVFCYKEKEAEDVLYYPKGMRVITSVMLHNNTGDGMYCYNFGTGLSKDTIANAFENDENGKLETHLFYCEPNSPYEKPDIEKNHTLFRDIVPKGDSFDNFSQETVDLIFSHVNAVKRKQFNGKSAYDVFTFYYSEILADALGISFIPPENVIQSPKLLKNIK